MLDDFVFAELYPISDLPKKLPAPPRGEHAASKIYTWLNLSNDPARKTLRSELIGRYRYTCDRWLREFSEGTATRLPHAPTSNQRNRQRERAKRELAEAGI